MAVNTQSNNNLAYGLANALQNLNPLPIIAKRAPSANDVGEFGQQWIYNNQVWMFTSAATWTELAAAGNAGTFTSLTVNGASAFNGGIVANTANNAITLDSGTATITISGDATANTIDIGTGAANKAIYIGNYSGSTGVVLNSGTGGITLNSNSTGDIVLFPNATTSSSLTVTNNAFMGTVAITIPSNVTTSGYLGITFNNNNIVNSTPPLLMSVLSNATGGGFFTIAGINGTSGTSVLINLQNTGSATINSGTVVVLSYILFA